MSPFKRQAGLAALDDVQFAAFIPCRTGRFQRLQEQRHQLGGAVAVNQANVEGVADLAIQGVAHHSRKSRGIGILVGDQPGAASAVEAYGGAGLLGDAAQLADRASRTPGHGQRQAPIGEHRPAGGVIDAFHQRHRSHRQTGGTQRWIQGVGDDGLRGAQGVAANAQHRSVASAQHTRGVSEDVRPAFENECDNAQR
ncbi:hypothetical protein D3C73_1165220 [compost metagenome]